jgi:hypothetical protein
MTYLDTMVRVFNIDSEQRSTQIERSSCSTHTSSISSVVAKRSVVALTSGLLLSCPYHRLLLLLAITKLKQSLSHAE